MAPAPSILGFVLALALPSAAWAVSGRDALDAGDRAWGQGHRREARVDWRMAAADTDPATRAQAHLRLLLVSGNLGWMVHGPQADRALALCPPTDAWCSLAQADYDLLLAQLGLPHDLDRASALAQRAAPALPGPAAARLVWAGHRPAEVLDGLVRDGLGDALLESHGRWPSGPGTWLLGLGITTAPGLGTGGLVRFVHPDLAWRGWRMDVVGTATTRGIGGLSASLLTRGQPWSLWQFQAGRSVVDLYDATDQPSTTLDLVGMRLAAAPGLRAGRWSTWLGPVARVDRDIDGQTWHGHGLHGGGRWDGRNDQDGPVALLSAEVSARPLADYDHLDFNLDLRWTHPAGPTHLALRLYAEALPWGAPPVWRVPALGGGRVLRAPPAGRWRDEQLSAGVAEWRVPLYKSVGAVVFAEGAWVDGLHRGLGAGLRLAMAPRPLNTVRLDVATGDAGWGITAGWGEAF